MDKDLLTVTYDTIRYYLWVAKELYANPYFYLILVSVFVLERIIPAKRGQRTFSRSLFQDFAWFNVYEMFQLGILPLYVGLLRAFYATHLGFLTLHAVEGWPIAWRVLVSIVAFDFLQWFHHVVRHKAEVFWYFHTIHHSQREMNLFTDGRVHILEPLIANTIMFIPMFMFQLNPSAVLSVAVVSRWYQRIYHANLRTHYGFLKYIMVTPQSHRIHHSVEPRHRDKNFGVMLTIWDRIFRTLHPNYEEYPETGVADGLFPFEQDAPARKILASLAAQFFYPFRMIFGKRVQEAVRYQ